MRVASSPCASMRLITLSSRLPSPLGSRIKPRVLNYITWSEDVSGRRGCARERERERGEKTGAPDAFSTLLWNNEPRKSNENTPRDASTRDLPELKQHYLFRGRVAGKRERPPSRTTILFSGREPGRALFLGIYRGRKSSREL